jgi:hypothetical protein
MSSASGVAGSSVTLLLGGITDGGVQEAADAGVTDGAATDNEGAPTSISVGPSGSSGATSVYGFTTLQMTTGRAAFIQAVLGDATLCGQLVVDGPISPGPTPNATARALLFPCSMLVTPQLGAGAGLSDGSPVGDGNESGRPDGEASAPEGGATLDGGVEDGPDGNVVD